METTSAEAAFVNILRRALNHLYDPPALRNHPLAELLDVARRGDTAPALRRILTEAIESLKPDQRVPTASNARRVYRILYYRYVEQFTQREVATDLALSIRQLRRQEKRALQVLADVLWNRYDLEHQEHRLTATLFKESKETAPVAEDDLTREQELEWLRRSMPSEAASLSALVAGVLHTLSPLIQASGVQVQSDIPDDLPALSVQLTTIRQALLNVVSTSIRRVPGGRVHIHAEATPGAVRAIVRASNGCHTCSSTEEDDAETLEMAQRLVQMSDGTLEVTRGVDEKGALTARLVLPAAEQTPVLCIDDNSDTLQLLRRYLSGTRYRFVGTSNPEEALALATQVAPQSIVLDVMLPGVDGWELLERLREHPQTCRTPVIVCTILPQEDTAMLLGAAAFIRKPVNRQALLSVLNHQAALLAKESSSAPPRTPEDGTPTGHPGR